MAQRRRITIRDVALAAGVSVTTVSDAVNGRGRLPEATRLRVAAVADELGYTANPGAQFLRHGRTGSVGLLLPEQSFSLQYYMDLSLGAAEEALAHDLALTLIPHSARGIGAVKQVDGVVISDARKGDPLLDAIVRAGATVTCERDLQSDERHAGRIVSDHAAATAGLLDQLAAAGARRIAMICPRDDTSFAFDIRQAYVQWCAEHAVHALVSDVEFASQPEEIARAVERILADPETVDAIVSVPDGGAITALQAAVGSGRRVPGDLLIASYVDSPMLRILTPPMTAVDLHPRAMGRQAVELLAQILDGRAPRGETRSLATTLHVRESTGGVSQPI